MISFVVGFALLLHVAFWGIGPALLAMPPRWRRFWPILVMPAGFATQSLVVWIGAYANLRGTNAYAWPSEILPLALFGLVVWRRGVRRFVDDFGRFGLVWMAMAGSLLALLLPLAFAAHGLTTVSLGSCDAADYAAGARVFMEHAHSDRSGFLGLTEVVRIMSVDNFFDFWLRLNHFTPSALMALNGSILHCPPHELAGILTAVVLAASVPVVFWISRALFGYTAIASLAIAALYGLSPIPWYSVAEVSPAPLLAAQAIALLNWAGIALWRGGADRGRTLRLWPVLAIGYVLVLGSYNFILTVSLAPAVLFVLGRAWRKGEWRLMSRWIGLMVTPLVACGLVFWARVAGLLERFLLFQTYDFGWRIPVLGPDGWLGMVRGADLEPWRWGGLHWLLALLVLAALGYGVIWAVRERRRRIWLVASIIVPVLAGYAFLEIRAVVAGTNASYDAFKLFAVFYPLLLPAFCWWITLRRSPRLIPWFAVVSFALVIFAFNALACVMFIVALSRPPLLVDGELRQVRRVEAMPDVASVNMLIPDMWSRLWANEFLLNKPQYFATHTYEGRLNTPLRGDWDLSSAVVRTNPGAGSYREVTAHYWLADTRAAGFFRALAGDGWYPEEQLANGERWRWLRVGATVRIENPHPYPVTARVRLDGRSLEPRQVALVPAGAKPPVSYAWINDQRRTVSLPEIQIPAGVSTWTLASPQPDVHPAGDARALAVCVFSLTFEGQPDASPTGR
ncbi:MAG TPA: hypothetical protein VHE61_04895 [Opitutaceae bacterium]|nr:hypothetical protein [Opitutaceae bacterium]